jgi:hypothetical protein
VAEAQLLRFDGNGLIREMALFGRPLPGLTAVMTGIAGPLLTRQKPAGRSAHRRGDRSAGGADEGRRAADRAVRRSRRKRSIALVARGGSPPVPAADRHRRTPYFKARFNAGGKVAVKRPPG